jgi:hypothetical protein
MDLFLSGLLDPDLGVEIPYNFDKLSMKTPPNCTYFCLVFLKKETLTFLQLQNVKKYSNIKGCFKFVAAF